MSFILFAWRSVTVHNETQRAANRIAGSFLSSLSPFLSSLSPSLWLSFFLFFSSTGSVLHENVVSLSPSVSLFLFLSHITRQRRPLNTGYCSPLLMWVAQCEVTYIDKESSIKRAQPWTGRMKRVDGERVRKIRWTHKSHDGCQSIPQSFK